MIESLYEKVKLTKKNGRSLVPGNFNNSWRSLFRYFYLHALNISYQNIPQNDAIESLILKALAILCQFFKSNVIYIMTFYRYTNSIKYVGLSITRLYLFLSSLNTNHKLEVLV